jgi:hypothetical protein
MTYPYQRAINQGLKALANRFEKPDFVAKPISTEMNALTMFLEKTDDIELSRSNRLIAFAHHYHRQLSWTQICEVYERILEEGSSAEQAAALATWTSLAEILLSSSERTDVEHEEITAGFVKLVERALGENGRNCSYALVLGEHYFREAMRREQNVEYIEQAQIWLDRVIEWADGEDDQDAQTCTYAILYTAHCHAALGEWSRALRFYNAVQIPMLTNDEDGAVFSKLLLQSV